MLSSHSMFVYYWHVDDDEKTMDTTQTIIRAYGIDKEKKNICLHVKGFTPFVYCELPQTKFTWNELNAQLVIDELHLKMKAENAPIKSAFTLKKRLYYANIDPVTKQPKLYPYLLLAFNTRLGIKELIYLTKKNIYVGGGIGSIKLRIHEQDATPLLQMISRQDIPSIGWIDFRGVKADSKQSVTYCDMEYSVSWRALSKNTTITGVAQPLIMSYDIEVNSNNPTAMPNSTSQEDVVFQISCVFHRFGDDTGEEDEKVLISLGKPTQEKVGNDVRIIECIHEGLLLDAYVNLIATKNPNIICGYNIFTFDIPYMIDRASMVFAAVEFSKQGFIKDRSAVKKTIKWSSSAFKNQEFQFLDAEGCLFIDMLPVIQRDYKFDNYKLKTVAEKFIGESKDPLTHQGIFRSYRLGTKKDDNGNISQRGCDMLGVCGKYCVQDSTLVIKLMDKLQVWIGLCELAKLCNVSIFTLYTQGQQIRVFSQVYKIAMYTNYVVEKEGYIPKENDHYVGATVLDPVPGLYDNILSFDFSSLYPSSIIAENIDYTTFINEYDDTQNMISDTCCNVIEWETHQGCEHDRTIHKVKPKIVICETQRHRWLKEPKGILPSLLEDLLSARKATRNRIKELEKKLEKEPQTSDIKLELVILDKRQLAYKIVANSCYGTMGVQKGYLPFMPGAMSTTAVGRRSIELISKYIPEKFNGELIYGDTDSSYIHFPDLDIPEINSQTMEKVWAFANKVAEDTSRLFKKPMKLEFENKLYTRFLILTKKRYMSLYCGRDGIVSEKIDKKGVLLARRDNSKIVRDIYSYIILMLFKRAEEKDVLNTVLDKVHSLFTRDEKMCNVSNFVITKTVRSSGDLVLRDIITEKVKSGSKIKMVEKGFIGDYKVTVLSKDENIRKQQLGLKKAENERDFYLKSLPAQIQLAEKMRARGQRVDTGSRLEYVITWSGSKASIKDKQYEKIEDVDYFKQHSNILAIDHLYYVKALSNPMDQVLKVVYGLNNFVLTQYKYRVQKVKIHEELLSLFVPKFSYIK